MPEASTSDHQDEQLTKSARKRLARAERLKQAKEFKKQRMKEQKAARRQEKLDAIEARQANLTAEEQERDKEERMARAKEYRLAKTKDKQERHARLEKAKQDDRWRVVIDFDFEAQMTPNEIRSIVQQTNFAFGANGKAKIPVHLVLTSIKGGIKEVFDQQVRVYESWAGVTVSSESFEEVYKDKKEQLVYLTAESDVEIETLQPEDIYVIGGIVDRNRHKGLCFEKAQALGIRTARLPLGQHLMGSGRSVVMCTNHVFDMLLGYLETEDWEAAVHRVIPERKRKNVS